MSSDENRIITSPATIEQSVQENRIITPIDWIFQHKFEVDVTLWNMMHVEGALKPVANEFFIIFLNHCLSGIPCVLKKTSGYTLASNFFVLVFKCMHKTCRRAYKILQVGGNEFIVFNNNTKVLHIKKVVRPVNGIQRRILEKTMIKMMPSEYREFCEKAVDKSLCRQGNLQECVSDETLRTIRCQGLKSGDFDNDDVYDILKMKLFAEYKHKLDSSQVVYIRRFYLDPYIVIAFTDAQFECLMHLADKIGLLKIFLDATGSIARHLGKILYYYAGVVSAKLNSADEKEVSRLLPVLEFLSGEHDKFNISVPLSLYKHQFHLRYPGKDWPIRHCVTDFSFALLNAVCHSWNNMKFIEYINYVYLFANGLYSWKDLKDAGIVTFLQLCIGHLAKTHSKDVAKYFPGCTNMAALKEIFAGMFDLNKLDTLRKVWKDLSTILLSKFITDEVQKSLKSVASIITKANEIEHEQEGDTEKDDDKLPMDVDEHETMYEESLFYQNFKALTFKPEFATTSTAIEKDSVNAFYSPEYADLFLKKYVSLLSLWTCLTQAERSANSCGECHFKNTKQRLHNKSRSIGSIPLKPGRFLREMESYSIATSSAILDEIPKGRCCDQNIRKSNKRKNDHEQDEYSAQPPKKKSLMDLYKIKPKIPKTSTTPTTAILSTRKPVNNSETTPTSSTKSLIPRKLKFDRSTEVDDFMKIDDVSSQETWNRKRKSKFSYIKKLNLRKIRGVPHFWIKWDRLDLMGFNGI